MNALGIIARRWSPGLLLLLLALVIAVPALTADPSFAQMEALDGAAIESDEQEPDGTIPLETTPADDRKIAARLQEIFDQIEGLDQITIGVTAGVVRMAGAVGSASARERATDLASRIEGVVEVIDDTVLDRDVGRRLAPTVKRIRALSRDVIGHLPLLVIAVLIVGAFWLLSRLGGSWASLYRRLTPNAFIAKLLRQIVQGLILLLGVILALSVLDASGLVGTVLGAAGLLGLALSFALRDTVENYIASILLSLRQPFEPNDEVLIDGHHGRVIRLTSRATVLLTLDGNHVRIPNATVFKGTIENYTRKPERRFTFTVGVDTAADLLEAQALAIRTLADAEGVLDDPPPAARVETLGDSSVVLWIAGWVDQRRYDHRKVRSAALRQVKEAFDQAEIEMPEPIYRLRFEQGASLDVPSVEQPSPTASKRPRDGVRATVDIARDTEIDESVAAERADPDAADLLDPAAPRE